MTMTYEEAPPPGLGRNALIAIGVVATLLGVAGGDLRERVTGGGIDDGEGLSGRRGQPLAPDVGPGG